MQQQQPDFFCVYFVFFIIFLMVLEFYVNCLLAGNLHEIPNSNFSEKILRIL